MKILILAYYVDGSIQGGGSSRFMKCVANTLIELGHDVISSIEPEKHIDKKYDLIICSHFLHRIKENPAPKICISHGIVDNEWIYPGAQRYISVSEEVKAHNLEHGILSEVINQPIVIREQKRPGKELGNILVIRRHDPKVDPFAFLAEKYDLKYSDPETPIEDQIAWADLCISLGRGALEAMAQGKPVLVADNRDYMGAIGDGYVTKENIKEIAKHNFSGRRYKIPLTREWIEDELKKYNQDDSDFLWNYIKKHHDCEKIVKRYLESASQNKGDYTMEGKGEKERPVNIAGEVSDEEFETEINETFKVVDEAKKTQPGLISVIIPTYHQAEMTQGCIRDVIEHTENCEIIIIDNGSDPPFQPPHTGFVECRVIRNDENKGFPVAVNQGLREAKGDIIVLLNNDVVVTPGAINHLVDWLETWDIVGPLTNYAGGMQGVQITSYQNVEGLHTEAEALMESSQGEGEEVQWIIGFCMVFKRSTWEKVGDFDTTFWPCTGEEVDFCLRSREQGFKVGIAHDVYVHHEGSITFRWMEDAGQVNYEDTCARNDKHLTEKWGFDFWKNQSLVGDIEAVPTSGINLNLGCGFKKIPGYVNIDMREEVEPDLVCDVIEGLPYEDNSVDMIIAHDFLEHIPIGKTIQVITEIWRVLKPGGKFDSLTPSTRGDGAFMDPHHVSFWNQNSWLYYSEKPYQELYGIKADFNIEKIDDMEIIPGLGIIHTHVIATAIKEFAMTEAPTPKENVKERGFDVDQVDRLDNLKNQGCY